jgi:acyl-CoA thioesterase II
MTDTAFDTSPQALTDRLATLLDVETLDTDLYRGAAIPDGKGRVFGGQVIGQALMAACNSVVAERLPHSLHAYFLRAGDNTRPILFRVERDFDGGSFTNRRVVASQGGVPILNMTASFQMPEEGLNHSTQMPNVPPPESLKTEQEQMLEWADRLPPEALEWTRVPRPIEQRPVEPSVNRLGEKSEPRHAIWVRTVGSLGDASQVMHRSVLAYLSDMALLSTGSRPHGVDWFHPQLQSASLDHAVWFHGDVRTDEWMLYVMDSPWSGQARSVNRGMLFARDGRLIASTAQEGLMRIRKPKG